MRPSLVFDQGRLSAEAGERVRKEAAHVVDIYTYLF
jgi:hypothetical protein